MVRVGSFLQGLGIDAKSFALRDGSGLDRKTQLSTGQLTKVLAASYRDFSIAPDLISSFSRFGKSGTLQKRSIGPKRARENPLLLGEGNRHQGVWAKTGTLAGVSTLAGFAKSYDNRIVAFAIFANGGVPKGSATRLEDAIVDAIVTEKRQKR